MEIRTLKYFLAIAKEKSFSAAGENVLFVTQPTLSRQMRDLEEELGVKLFHRTGKKTLLTEDGLRFKKRVEEILDLVQRTSAEFESRAEEEIAGEVFVGSGETPGIQIIGKAFQKLHAKYPNIRLNLFSGNAQDVAEKLDRGLIDFGVFIEPVNKEKYNYLNLPQKDIWGIIVRRDSDLAKLQSCSPKDLANVPLIVSRQALLSNELSGWFGKSVKQLNIVATYNLLYNASRLVEEGLGVALSLDKLVNTTETGKLRFVPLNPPHEASLVIAWKNLEGLSPFSRAAEKFLEFLRKELD